jgi:hypothetical protein
MTYGQWAASRERYTWSSNFIGNRHNNEPPGEFESIVHATYQRRLIFRSRKRWTILSLHRLVMVSSTLSHRVAATIAPFCRPSSLLAS